MARRRKGAIEEVGERGWAFALIFFLLFALTLGFLSFVGATPDASDQSAYDQSPASTTSTALSGAPQQPVRVVAKSIGLDVVVVNPTSTDIDTLDNELTQGAVRYPTSGLLGEKGTVLLFGHSSYLPVIIHQYYKTFDGIQNLKTGDIVSVYSSDTEYRFSVTGVRVADANDPQGDVIDLPNDAQYLTLITCDSFATKSNRYIVTADFAGSSPATQ